MSDDSVYVTSEDIAWLKETSVHAHRVGVLDAAVRLAERVAARAASDERDLVFNKISDALYPQHAAMPDPDALTATPPFISNTSGRPCDCGCHTNPNIKHFVACCNPEIYRPDPYFEDDQGVFPCPWVYGGRDHRPHLWGDNQRFTCQGHGSA